MSSFNYSEMGSETSQPIYLLDFAAGTEHWRYTTAPYDVVYDGYTYTQEPGLVIGDHEVTDSEQRVILDITVHRSNALIQRLLINPPDIPISLTEYKGHGDQTWYYQLFGQGTMGTGIFGGHSWVQPWSGYVLGYEFSERNLAKFKCSPTWSDIGVGGFCWRASTLCQVPLGSTACGVTLSTYSASGTVLTVSGTTVTAAVFGLQSAGYYTNGKFVTSTHSRMIMSHTGTTIVLSHSIYGLAVGAAFTCYPGCDHVWDSHCKTRYSNGLNFRGQPHRATWNIHKRGVL